MIGDPRGWLEAMAGAPVPADARVEPVERGGRVVGVACWSHWYYAAGEPVDAELTLHMIEPSTHATVPALLRRGFEEFGLDRITMHPMTDESRRLGELAGFRLEGIKRGFECDDAAIYGITRGDFQEGRKR